MALFKRSKPQPVPASSPPCPYKDDYEVKLDRYDRNTLKEHAHRLESTIRQALADGNRERIGKIVWQLCHDYAYAVHQPHARNGGLIGLAAAAIALGSVRQSAYKMVDVDLISVGSRAIPE